MSGSVGNPTSIRTFARQVLTLFAGECDRAWVDYSRSSGPDPGPGGGVR
jgi:hypothetical protein